MLAGSRGDYQWLEIERELDEVVSVCPEIIEGKYPVVTSGDSGAYRLSAEDRTRGWTDDGEIAYGPRSASIAAGGYDEWYIFENRPQPLGTICRDNVFVSGIEKGRVFAFINFYAFDFSSAEMKDVADLFWKQIYWMQPESYLANGEWPTLFATRNAALFEAVVKRF